MTEILYSIDLFLFHFINNTLSNPFFDKFFPFITNVKHWYIAYIILWAILLLKGGKKGKIAAVMIILLITFSDQINSGLLKNIFERIRPCNALENINVLIHCSGSYSFPSSHAVNNFAVAYYFYGLFPKLKWTLFTIASLIAVSRPYVGVHYPSDIIAGAIIGIVIGYIFIKITLQIEIYLNRNKKSYENKT